MAIIALAKRWEARSILKSESQKICCVNMPTDADIQVIIVNWRRPKNIPAIIEAFRKQSIPCAITVCDVGGDGFCLSAETLRAADDAFVWDRNYGSFNRYIPAFGFEKEFCWFQDDDMIPGPELLAHMLSFRNLLFSVLGQSGRRMRGDRYHLVKPDVDPKEVDFVCRGYLVRTELLHNVLRFKWEAQLKAPVITEDDILLAIAIETYTGLRPWLASKPPSAAKMDLAGLPEPYACCRMPGHYKRRAAFYNKYKRISESIRTGGSEGSLGEVSSKSSDEPGN